MKYRQCLLGRGTTKQVAFIPEHFAHVGKYLKLRGQDGWQVLAAWSLNAAGNLLGFNERGHQDLFGSLQ